MNILFLVFHGFSEANGISKKIHSQIDALRACGHSVRLCYYTVDEHGYRKRMIDDCTLENYGRGIWAKIRKRYSYNAIAKYARSNNISFVYIRSDHNANPFTIRLVKKLRKEEIKVSMEIPTYPYDSEYDTAAWTVKFQWWIDKLYRNTLAKHLNNIITFSDEKKIFQVNTIRISNGVDFDVVKLTPGKENRTEYLNLLGVAEVHYWHGFDRLINGLGEYYKQPQKLKVYFHVVGGIWHQDMDFFNQLIREYHIEEYVIFHGQKYGEELDKLFESADFCIGSLARHRTGINKIKTLKNREYAARGIPFIYSETDNDFDNMPYVLKASPDESPIDIRQITAFCEKNRFSPSQVRESIRSLSWKNQMQKVIDETF